MKQREMEGSEKKGEPIDTLPRDFVRNRENERRNRQTPDDTRITGNGQRVTGGKR